MAITFLEKLKAAFRDPVCWGCRREPVAPGDGVAQVYCSHCRRGLGIRDAKPLWKKANMTLYAATQWTPWAKSLVYGYKFYGRRNNLGRLSDLLASYWGAVSTVLAPSGPVWVMSVPARTADRTHAVRLAKRFAQRTENTLWYPLLSWARPTVTHHKLMSRRERMKNIQGAFVLPSMVPDTQPPAAIVIIDDLTTTGATLQTAMAACREQLPFGEEVPIVGLALMSLTYRTDPADPAMAAVIAAENPGENHWDGLIV